MGPFISDIVNLWDLGGVMGEVVAPALPARNRHSATGRNFLDALCTFSYSLLITQTLGLPSNTAQRLLVLLPGLQR